MSFADLLAELEAMHLPGDAYAITGSGPLAVRGLRAAEDLDLVVTDALWRQLAARHSVRLVHQGALEIIEIGRVQILGPGSHFADPAIAGVETVIATADVIGGHPYVRLDLLRRFKQALGREKDVRDIELIDRALSASHQAATPLHEQLL